VLALDLATGKELWRAYHTGPDADVRIGPDFHPFYEKDRGTDLGVSTWPPDQWKLGGGTTWGWISYDPQLNLVYYGTGNPGVWNPDIREGDNKWSCTIFARNPTPGRRSGRTRSAVTTRGTTTRSWRTCSSTCRGAGG
jgi:alcohol dehydrogenase (cytochrome c)